MDPNFYIELLGTEKEARRYRLIYKSRVFNDLISGPIYESRVCWFYGERPLEVTRDIYGRRSELSTFEGTLESGLGIESLRKSEMSKTPRVADRVG